MGGREEGRVREGKIDREGAEELSLHKLVDIASNSLYSFSNA